VVKRKTGPKRILNNLGRGATVQGQRHGYLNDFGEIHVMRAAKAIFGRDFGRFWNRAVGVKGDGRRDKWKFI
jgi:hypothetical protein